jgi:hypothetical protein
MARKKSASKLNDMPRRYTDELQVRTGNQQNWLIVDVG